MKIRYIGPFGLNTGYGRAGMDLLEAFRRNGDLVEIRPTHKFDLDTLDPFYEPLKPFLNPLDGLPEATIVHTMPGYLDDYRGQVNGKPVAYTTWETSTCPFSFVQWGKVITPSYASWASMQKHKCASVTAIPHVLYPERWGRKLNPRRDRPFTFLYVGAWNTRKNPEGVVRAYLNEFGGADDVKLIIKVGPSDEQRARLAIQRLVRCADTPNRGPIELDGRMLPQEHLKKLYVQSDCFVSAHRGEAFGLGCFEAAVSGLPVVYTDIGGPTDFLGDYDYAVGFQLTPAIPDEEYVLDGDRIVGGRHFSPKGMTCKQFWAEPNLESFGEKMRLAYRHHHDWCVKRRDYESFVENYHWRKIAERFHSAIREG